METIANTSSGDAMKDVKRTLPSDLEQVKTVIKYDILKHLRSRRLLGMLVIEALILILISALVLSEPAQPFNITMSNYAGLASTLIIIGATLFAGDAIVSEFQSKTGFLLFPNPVKRSSIFIGKFLTASIIMALVMAIYYGIAFGIGVTVSSNLDHLELGFYSFLLAILYSVATVALGLLVSSIMKGSTGALILTFFVLFMILPSVDSVFSLTKDISPWFSLTYAGGAISAILSVPYPAETVDLMQQGFSLFVHTPSVEVATLLMVVWTAATILLALFLFKRREMAA